MIILVLPPAAGDSYLVAGGMMHDDGGGAVSVRDSKDDGDPMQATKVVAFAKVNNGSSVLMTRLTPPYS
jgi:hypothetical protein